MIKTHPDKLRVGQEVVVKGGCMSVTVRGTVVYIKPTENSRRLTRVLLDLGPVRHEAGWRGIDTYEMTYGVKLSSDRWYWWIEQDQAVYVVPHTPCQHLAALLEQKLGRVPT